MKRTDKIVGGIYLTASLFLALFCLYQSHRMGHDQSAREIAGRALHVQTDIPAPYTSPKKIVNFKKLGEND